MTRTPPLAGLALIQEFEGFSPTIYTCPAGKLTIGWGHVVKMTDRIVPPITQDRALALLRADLAPIEAFLAGAVPTATQGQFDACASLAYNIGLGAFQKSTLLAKFKAGDIPGAAAQFARWVHSNGKPLPGLIRRRKAEMAIFLGEQA